MIRTAALVVYGPLSQRTGGYLYDALVARELEDSGRFRIDVVSIERGEAPAAVARRILATGADAVIADELCHPELAPVLPALSIPRLLLVHHLGRWEVEGSATASASEDACLAVADVVITTSARSAARLADEGATRAPVVVVEPGADRLPRVRRRPREGGPLSLLFVGALAPRKRVLALLDAAARTAARVTTAGPPRDPTYATEVHARAAATPGARVLGEVDDDALAELLAAHDALVLPSSLEGYGMVQTEALAAGLPVIASRAAGVPAALAHGRTALLFDEGGLDGAIAAFARDAELRARLEAGAAGARLPTWREAGAAFARVLDQAIAAGRGARDAPSASS